MSERINLDSITSCEPSASAIRAMLPFFETHWGSLSSPHALGQELLPEVEKSLKAIYGLAKVSEDDLFVFTSSGQEAVTQVVQSVYRSVSRKHGKNHFVTSCLDEAASILAISRLEEDGCVLRMAHVTKNGYVTKDTIADCITPRTALVSLSWGSALTGVFQHVDEVADLCKQRGILLHLDITHVLGKVFLDTAHIPWNYLTFNGVQLHAPQGTGGLFIKKGAPISPIIFGDKDLIQMRGGSMNVPLLSALGQAAEEMKQNQNLYSIEVARLRNMFEQKIQEGCPEAKVLFKDEERLPHCSTIAFPGVKSELLLFELNRKQIFANMGGGTYQQIELVLSASHIDPILAKCALSFSLSKNTTEQQVTSAAQIIQEIILKLRKISRGVV
jgi:cysteine desulfurase